MPPLAFRRFIARRILALPSPILRLMSGGVAVYQGGRTLDPRFQYLAAHTRGDRPVTAMTPDEARRAASEGFSAVTRDRPPGVTADGFTIPGPGGDIPVRAYRSPAQNPQTPVLVFAHLGGGVIGDLQTADALCGLLARLARCCVLSVDYRLAPEHPFPAAFEDLLAAYHWARANGARLGAPEGEAAIGGEGLGAGLAAAVVQALKRAGEPQPALQLLIAPTVDLADNSPSMTTYAQAFPLSRDAFAWFTGHYMGPDADPADPRLSPLREDSLQGLAPAIVVTAGFDPLLDQGEAYALKLKAAGVPVTYRRYDSLVRAFTAFTGGVPAAEAACREIAALVRQGLEERLT